MDPHPARTFHQRQLPLLAEVQTKNSLAVNLLGRIVGLVTEVRVVARSVKSLGRILLEKESPFEREPVLVIAPGLVIDIDVARDSFLRAGLRVPIRVRRRICEVAKVAARPRSEERRVGKE